jgi:hypothetical protein
VSIKELVEKTGIICIIAKTGRYGGTYAHKDIAFHFGMWISPRFQLLLVKEFQRLKEAEQKLLGWSAKRELAKINYHIHTDAIKENLIPKELTAKQAAVIYADEADVLNVALFGITAADWRKKNPGKKGNIQRGTSRFALGGMFRDYANINELICLSNMENINAVLINDGIKQSERLLKLNKIAIQQMTILSGIEERKLLR